MKCITLIDEDAMDLLLGNDNTEANQKAYWKGCATGATISALLCLMGAVIYLYFEMVII